LKFNFRCGLHQLPGHFDLGKDGLPHKQDHHILPDHNKHERLSLFEQKRIKGWWPCILDASGEIAVFFAIVLLCFKIFF